LSFKFVVVVVTMIGKYCLANLLELPEEKLLRQFQIREESCPCKMQERWRCQNTMQPEALAAILLRGDLFIRSVAVYTKYQFC